MPDEFKHVNARGNYRKSQNELNEHKLRNIYRIDLSIEIGHGNTPREIGDGQLEWCTTPRLMDGTKSLRH